MSRWRNLLDRRGARDEPPQPGADAPATHHREFAVALAGAVGTLVDRLRDDPGGQWPLVEALPMAPTAALVPADVRADALWFRLRGTGEPWGGPVLRLVSLAEACGAKVAALVPLDVATDVEFRWLDDQLWRAADEHHGAVPRARLERLAGPAFVDRLIVLMRDAAVDRLVRGSAARALPTIVLNAPVGGVLGQAVAAVAELAHGDRFDQRLAGRVLRELVQGSPLVAHGIAQPLDEARLAALADHPGWRISGAALDLLAALPGSPRPATVEHLRRIAATGLSSEELALPGVERAIACLASARPEPEVVALVRDLAERGSSANVRREAAAALVGLLGDEARDVWLDLLSSTKVGDIATGERLLRRFGAAEDVPVALVAAHRLLRRRANDEPRMLRHPPRGAELLSFLAAHRGQVEVDALFVEVRGRWEHLPPDLRGWISEHLPWLGPLA